MSKYVKSAVMNLGDEPVDVRIQIASSEDTLPEVLVQLANDENWEVREQVAMNPNTPWDTLVKLGNYDESWPVRRSAYVYYSVEISFGGYIGATEFIEVHAPAGISKDDLRTLVLEDYDSDLLDFLSVSETEYLGDSEWEITFNFNGYIGFDVSYTIYGYEADEEDDAVDEALEMEAIFDFGIVDFKYVGR